MSQRFALMLGILMIAAGLLGGSLTLVSQGVSAQEDQRSPAHEQMHAMMDAMMGEGFSERMHAAMPGSEEMMEACANAMQGGGMMNGMMQGGMMGAEGMNMQDGMMDER